MEKVFNVHVSIKIDMEVHGKKTKEDAIRWASMNWDDHITHDDIEITVEE